MANRLFYARLPMVPKPAGTLTRTSSNGRGVRSSGCSPSSSSSTSPLQADWFLAAFAR